MALSAAFLADKSALTRFRVPTVAHRLRPLLEEGLIATCTIVDLEERRSLDVARITQEVMTGPIAAVPFGSRPA